MPRYAKQVMHVNEVAIVELAENTSSVLISVRNYASSMKRRQ